MARESRPFGHTKVLVLPTRAGRHLTRGERTLGAYRRRCGGKRNPICVPGRNGMRSTGREVCQWRPRAVGYFSGRTAQNGGVADSLDEAKAAFRAAWEALG